MHYINEINNKGLFDMAKTSFSTMYMNCNDGLNALLYEVWKFYENKDNNPKLTPALKLAADIYEKKLDMFQNGPVTMQIKRLHDKVDEMSRTVFEDSNTVAVRFLPRDKDNNNENPNANTNVNLNDLGKP